MGYKRLTSEQIAEMQVLRAQGMAIEALGVEYGVSKATVSYHTSKLTKGESKICPNRKKQMDFDANFCSRCGTDIRDERDLLIYQIGILRGFLVHLPENARAKADSITKEIINYLKKSKVSK